MILAVIFPSIQPGGHFCMCLFCKKCYFPLYFLAQHLRRLLGDICCWSRPIPSNSLMIDVSNQHTKKTIHMYVLSHVICIQHFTWHLKCFKQFKHEARSTRGLSTGGAGVQMLALLRYIFTT